MSLVPTWVLAQDGNYYSNPIVIGVEPDGAAVATEEVSPRAPDRVARCAVGRERRGSSADRGVSASRRSK